MSQSSAANNIRSTRPRTPTEDSTSQNQRGRRIQRASGSQERIQSKSLEHSPQGATSSTVRDRIRSSSAARAPSPVPSTSTRSQVDDSRLRSMVSTNLSHTNVFRPADPNPTDAFFNSKEQALWRFADRSPTQRHCEYREAMKSEATLEKIRDKLKDAGSKVRLNLVWEALDLARLRTNYAREDMREGFESKPEPRNLRQAKNDVSSMLKRHNYALDREDKIRLIRNKLREFGQSKALDAVREALYQAKVESKNAKEDLEVAKDRLQVFTTGERSRYASATQRHLDVVPVFDKRTSESIIRPSGFPVDRMPAYQGYQLVGRHKHRESISEAEARILAAIKTEEEEERKIDKACTLEKYTLELIERDHNRATNSQLKQLAQDALDFTKARLTLSQDALKAAKQKINILYQDLDEIGLDDEFIRLMQER